MLWRVATIIASVVETLVANVQMLIILHNHDCGKVDIDITIMKNTSRLFL